jgi:hypothetical protein
MGWVRACRAGMGQAPAAKRPGCSRRCSVALWTTDDKPIYRNGPSFRFTQLQTHLRLGQSHQDKNKHLPLKCSGICTFSWVASTRSGEHACNAKAANRSGHQEHRRWERLAGKWMLATTGTQYLSMCAPSKTSGTKLPRQAIAFEVLGLAFEVLGLSAFLLG